MSHAGISFKMSLFGWLGCQDPVFFDTYKTKNYFFKYLEVKVITELQLLQGINKYLIILFYIFLELFLTKASWSFPNIYLSKQLICAKMSEFIDKKTEA